VSAQYGTRSGGGGYTSQHAKFPRLADGVRGFFFTDITDLNTTQLAETGWRAVTRAYHLEEGQPWSVLDTHSGYSPTTSENEFVRGIMAAKFYKMNSHLLPELQDADMILWSDSSTIALRNELGVHGIGSQTIAERAATLLGDDDAVLEWHEYRTRVADEIGPAVKRAHDETKMSNIGDVTLQGYRVMQSEGFQDDGGLYKSEQFLYRARSRAMKQMMAYWWTFSHTYSFRDQIGMPWALKKNDVKFKAPCKCRGDSGFSCVLETISKTKPA